MTMPIFFASNAIYPIAVMPRWLKTIAYLNPLTFQVDALRALMVQGGASLFGVGTDLLSMLAGGAVLVIIAARLYPSIAE